MNKNKKGFISMTLVYTFLVIFLFLMLAILNTYTQKDKFLEAINSKINDDIGKNKATRSSIINKVLEENTPVPYTRYSPINIANKAYSNGNGLFYIDNVSITDENGDGVSNRIYFFRGQIETNHVVFAKLCWRIIRTNEDGSTRLMYDGPATIDNKCKTHDQIVSSGTNPRSIGTVKFNAASNNAAYTGFMYKGTEVLEADDENPQSLIKKMLDAWYRSNIADTLNENNNNSYANSVSPAIYCSDRTYLSKQITPWFIDDHDHNMYNTANIKNSITLICPGEKNASGVYTRDDRFNVVDNVNGNKLLFYPVGLVSAQEVALAGGYLRSDDDLFEGGNNGMINEGYYMYTGRNYWTMSPYGFDSGVARVVYVNSQGYMQPASVTNNFDVIPVLSLKVSAAVKTGNGSPDNPFIIR